jgi:hypothetical protein
MALTANQKQALTEKLRRMFPKRTLGPLNHTDYDFLRFMNSIVHSRRGKNNNTIKTGIPGLEKMIAGHNNKFVNIWPNNWSGPVEQRYQQQFERVLKKYGVNRPGLMKLYVETMKQNKAHRTGMTLNQKKALQNRIKSAIGFKYPPKMKKENIPNLNEQLARFYYTKRGRPDMWVHANFASRHKKAVANNTLRNRVVEILPALQVRYPNIQMHYMNAPKGLNATKKYVNLNNYLNFRKEKAIKHRFNSAIALQAVGNKLTALFRKSLMKTGRRMYFENSRGIPIKGTRKVNMSVKSSSVRNAEAAAAKAKKNANNEMRNALAGARLEHRRLVQEEQARRLGRPHNAETWLRNNRGAVTRKRKSPPPNNR